MTCPVVSSSSLPSVIYIALQLQDQRGGGEEQDTGEEEGDGKEEEEEAT